CKRVLPALQRRDETCLVAERVCDLHVEGNGKRWSPVRDAPTVTMTGPVAAPSGTWATICESLQLVIVVAVPPLKDTVLLPCVAPNPDPEIVTEAPGAPDVGDTPVTTGFDSELPSVTETLSNMAVFRLAELLLLTPNPTYTISGVVMICAPTRTQVIPSPEA